MQSRQGPRWGTRNLALVNARRVPLRGSERPLRERATRRKGALSCALGRCGNRQRRSTNSARRECLTVKRGGAPARVSAWSCRTWTAWNQLITIAEPRRSPFPAHRAPSPTRHGHPCRGVRRVEHWPNLPKHEPAVIPLGLPCARPRTYRQTVALSRHAAVTKTDTVPSIK